MKSRIHLPIGILCVEVIDRNLKILYFLVIHYPLLHIFNRGILTGKMECPDFSEFQEILKSMRKPHDIIVNTINAVISTHSLPSDDRAACKNLHEQLDDGNTKREKFIRNCITQTTDRVKQLKDQREVHSDDIQISKQLRAEQTKLRMLQVELTVEDLIKERTAKVFNERCRQYYKPL